MGLHPARLGLHATLVAEKAAKETSQGKTLGFSCLVDVERFGFSYPKPVSRDFGIPKHGPNLQIGTTLGL